MKPTLTFTLSLLGTISWAFLAVTATTQTEVLTALTFLGVTFLLMAWETCLMVIKKEEESKVKVKKD